MAHRCYHNIDKPILVLGLEYQDWAVVLAVFLFFIIVPYLSNLTVLSLAMIVACVLRILKLRRPPGYIWHLLYRAGVPLPYLLPPGVTRYSPFPRRATGLLWRRTLDESSSRLLEQSRAQ